MQESSDETLQSWRSIMRSALSPRRIIAFVVISRWFNGANLRARLDRLLPAVPDRTNKKRPGLSPIIPRSTNGSTRPQPRRAPGSMRLSRRRFTDSRRSSSRGSVSIGPRVMSTAWSPTVFSPPFNGAWRPSGIKPVSEPPSKKALISPVLYQCEAILARSLERQ